VRKFVRLTQISSENIQVTRLDTPFVSLCLRRFDIMSSDGNPLMQSNCIPTSLAVSVYYPLYAHAYALPLCLNHLLEFVSSSRTSLVSWNTILTPKSIYHMAQQSTLQIFKENNDMAEDGSQILAYTPVISPLVTSMRGSHSSLISQN
jgi:hypothetical protein